HVFLLHLKLCFLIEAYGAVVSVVSPGQQSLTGDSLRSLFNTLEKRVQCGGVSCEKSCVTADQIMMEVNASSPDTEQEVGAVLGRVLYHALLGRCFISRSLPEESFFLDYILDHVGSQNFTVWDLEALMKSLKIGSKETDEHGHEDHDQEHDQEHEQEHAHDHGGLRRRKRSSHEIHEGLTHLICSLSLSLSISLVGYIYATIANLLITLTSMCGIFLLLCTSCTSVFQLCIQFCISLAVGSLTGDAFLHLLPMFLGLHVHSDEGDSHDGHQEETPDYIYKILVLLSGIYYFYLMETIFSLVAYKNKNHHHHQHHHGEESEPHHCDHGRVLEMYQQERNKKEHTASKTDLVGNEENEKSHSEHKERTREQRLLPFMITIGDGIHNFADGLAMGAAFSLSWRSGLATSLAVLCHELPHELGDFAILLHSGVSVRNALLLNVGSSLTSFVGLYIALSVATDLATQQWIAAITAGLFLYVGLADMLPTMVHISNKRPWLMFLLQNLGLLIGWGILLLLSLYEEKISF
uniref:Solute carrier family 39 member 4 n=1 Tax=Labrus bergylta TaxID=56723 RepID=A0A3Q3FK45_9LABR